MVDSARRDVELRVRAVLEGGGTLREAREEVRRWNEEMRSQTERYRTLNRELETRIRLMREEQQQSQRSRTATGGGQQTLFGLRPYELQNLSYQLNDVVTQLAAGAHFSQVFAQQGGQIFQLWGRNLFDLVRYLPQFAAGIAAITVAVQALHRSLQQVTAERQFAVLLRTTGDGAGYSSKELFELQRQIERLGVSWTQAGEMIRTALPAGVNQRAILQLADIANNLAVREGQDPAKVFRELVSALHDGAEGIEKFDAAYRLLDPEQLRRIDRLQREEGLQAAQNAAIAMLSEKLRGAARDFGPFSAEALKLSNAWHDFLDTLNRSGAITRAIEAINILIGRVTVLVQLLDDLVKLVSNAPGLKQLIDWADKAPALLGPGGPFALLRGAGRAFDWLTGTGPAGPDPNKTGWQDAARAQQAGGTGGAAFINRMTADTEELRQGIEALDQATRRAGLPAGYRVEVISTERPGATVAGTGTPSQHAEGKAIDVRIVDESGRPIPGSMGLRPRGTDTTGFYGKLDTAFEAYMSQRFPGQPYSIGTRFQREPDPGHYGVGRGREQLGQGAREGRTGDAFSPTPEDLRRSERALETDNRRYDIQHDLDATKARAAILAQAELDATSQGLLLDQRREFINRRVFDFDQDRAEKTRKFEQDIATQRITDGKNSAAIDAAGIAAREKAVALARGAISLEQAQTAEMQGREEARKLYGNQEAARQAQRKIDQDLAQRGLAVELKSMTDISAVQDAIRQKQKLQREEQDKQIADFRAKGLTVSVNEQLRTQIEGREVAQGTAEAFLRQLNTLAQTRQETITAINASVASGGMTLAEAEDATKRAFESTTPAIQDATKALEEFVRTSKDLDPTKADQYIAKLKQVRAEAQYVSPLFKTIRDTFEQSFSTGLSTAFNTIAESIGGLIAKTKTWGDVLRSVRTAALNFFAQLLRDIATAILRYEALKLASSLFGVKTPGAEGGILSFLFGTGGKAAGNIAAGTGAGAGINTNLATGATSDVAGSGVAAGGGGFFSWLGFHQGGVVGRGGTPRQAPAYWFANAPRYHNGSLIGLAPDEQAAILQRGEEVLSADSPRNMMNGGGRGGGINIRNVLIDDPRRVPEAMSGAVGERVIVQTLVKNAATIRELVKG